MDTKLLIVVIDNGRGDLLSQTVPSMNQSLVHFPPGCQIYKLLIDDSGSADYAHHLHSTYSAIFDEIICHPKNLGLSGSIRTAWQRAADIDVDYVWHQEGDFTFNAEINISQIAELLRQDCHLAQVALKRQPCNPLEQEYGGFMQVNPASYSYDPTKDCTTHRNFFTLNPCLYPKWVVKLGWQAGWGEAEFSELLFSDELTRCAYVGGIDDEPLVHHIGFYRGEGWFV